jgi:DNA-binding FadR family transcriptional regulator
MNSRMRLRHLRPDGARSCHDQVARALAMEVLSGLYPPNTNLPTESELMDRFQVSRTVIREVMKTLSAKGLVVLKTRVGTRALDPQQWNYFDADLLSWRAELGLDEPFRQSLAEIRLAVEPAAAALAAQRRTPEQIKRLRACIERMSGEHHSRASFADADLEFHQAVAAASANPLMRSISSVTEAALLIAFSENSPMDHAEEHAKTMAAHAEVVERIAAGDSEGARQAMTFVIEVGQRRIAATRHASPTQKPPLARKPARRKARR